MYASFGFGGTPSPENNRAPSISCDSMWFDSAAILNQYAAPEWSGGFLFSNAIRPREYWASTLPWLASVVNSFILFSKSLISWLFEALFIIINIKNYQIIFLL